MALYVITVAWALRARLIEQGQGALPLLALLASVGGGAARGHIGLKPARGPLPLLAFRAGG